MNGTEEIGRDDLESYYKVYREPSVLTLREILSDLGHSQQLIMEDKHAL